jgi:hypothetical protein
MHLVSALTDQLGGELEMSGDKGTRFKVTFATDAASDKKEQPRLSSLEAASLAVSS